jgi:hypothetical protein
MQSQRNLELVVTFAGAAQVRKLLIPGRRSHSDVGLQFELRTLLLYAYENMSQVGG